MAVSHIMLEAYKKYILVSLILHGKVQPLPKYTSQIVGRFIKVRANGVNRSICASNVLVLLVVQLCDAGVLVFFSFSSHS